jgi:cellulose synthase/poly-beta-1,6-N-acetylglucosamine synthase-like glycosyltransferase
MCSTAAPTDFASCSSRLFVPPDDSPIVATADTSDENLCWLRATYPCARIVGASKAQILARLEHRFGADLAFAAVDALAHSSPALSARSVLSSKQAMVLSFLAVALVISFALRPGDTCLALATVASTAFIAGALTRCALAWIGGRCVETPTFRADDDASLPSYTILVPLYREANVLRRLVAALRELDYPPDKLDIKLIVESDDVETTAIAQRLARESDFHLVRVPAGEPRTKPRACNYALAYARGDFTVIFDAEDRPEPDQLRKAVARFRREPRELVCLQARLGFYNADENWLTRLSAFDYALLFGVLLPALEALEVPIPLGGTSNHFRTSALRAVGAWDPFNVTEDADLGIRLAQSRMRVAMLDSTTFEEAPTSFAGWLKQRSRWLKGYMQTWLVHMRDPNALRRRTGWRGFLSLQLFLGGSVIAALVNPLLWLLFLTTVRFGLSADLFAPGPAATSISSLGLLGGNALLTCLAISAPKRRDWTGITPYAFTVTFYWALISIAAWRGLWQLVTRPFYWEKTAHGLSRLDQPAR